MTFKHGTLNGHRYHGCRCERCVTKFRAYHRAHYHKVKLQVYWARIRKRYGVTQQQYRRLLTAQNYAYAICERDLRTLHRQHADVDHCHRTQQVRGLLCGRCNTHLGWFENNALAVKAYLNHGRHQKLI